MRKPNLIIGKKQIIMSCLALMLAIAVYVNYTLAGDADLGMDAVPTGQNLTADSAADLTEDAKADGEPETYGDTQLVNSSAEGYFAEARLEKQTSRDAAVQTLQTILSGGDLSDDERVTNALNAVELSRLVESEGNIETLIKAQGYQDCVVYLDGDSAKVVVQTEGLDSAQAAAIKDVILGEVTIPTENIRIFEVK